MFTHPYAAEMLAAQRIRELRADAYRTRLARQLRTERPSQSQQTSSRRAHRHRNLWTAWQDRRRTATKAT